MLVKMPVAEWFAFPLHTRPGQVVVSDSRDDGFAVLEVLLLTEARARGFTAQHFANGENVREVINSAIEAGHGLQ